MAVRAVRGFDVRLGPGAPPFFGSAEDTDYLLRIMKAGVDVGRTPCIRLFHPEVRYDMPNLDRKACAYGVTRMFLLKKHRFPLWFQWINLLYPLILLPWETLRRGRGAAIYRYASFRGRFQGLRDVISGARTL